MIGVASSLQGQGSGSPASGVGRLPPDDRLSRVAHRRHTYAVQVASYALGAAVLLPYAHVGTITMVIPAAFLVSGVSLIGLFAGLSEARFNDRFEDHYLTVAQVIGHLIVQLGFLIAAPQIGYAFLNVLFLIYGVAALRMTPRQAVLVWMLTAAAVAAIFLRTEMPIGMPSATPAERLAAALCFVVTIGQCAFVGLYGDSLRKKLYRRGVELSEAYERIEELAELDELTGSFNRRCIMRSLEDEIARAHRSQIPCSVALIDLDWFKRINDVYGHPIGDEVLRTFAICMYANIRGVDRLGRYGGEEFLMVLPGTSHEVAARMLDRLREIIANLDWSAFSSSMQVTISAGLVTLRPDETSESLLARADHALYQAKAGGRNRIAAA
jgi:diguanylate cyclase (GGDEF)-like protein